MTDDTGKNIRPAGGVFRPMSTGSKMLFVGIVMVAVFVAAYAIIGSNETTRQACGPGKSCNYDLAAFQKTDPNIVKYEPAATLSTGLKNARGIAVGPDDKVYVTGGKLVRIFAYRTMKSEITLDAAAECMAVAPDGTIYLGMRDHVEAWAWSPDGARKESWPSLGERAFITSIAATEKDVFVADAGNRVILRYDRAGTLVNRIGQKDEARNVPGLVVPSHHLDVAMGPDGLLRVVNPGRHLIEAYTLEGDRETAWGKPSTEPDGFPGCCNPTDIAIHGSMLFAADKGLLRVKAYEIDGTFIGLVAGPEAFAKVYEKGEPEDFHGLDLAVDSKGEVLVLDPSTGDVRVFIPKQARR